MSGEPPRPSRPVLRVVRGEPTAEELAALIVVLAARAAAIEPPPPPASAWRDRSQLVRRPLAHGAGAWRSSAWPP